MTSDSLEQENIELRLQLNRIEEKLDIIARANGERVSQWVDPMQRRARSSFTATLLFLVVFALNWVLVFGTLPVVVDLPVGMYEPPQRELFLALRYIVVGIIIPLVNWYAPDACVAIFLGFVAGYTAVRDLTHGYAVSPRYGFIDERAVYLQVYSIGSIVAAVSYVSVKLARSLR